MAKLEAAPHPTRLQMLRLLGHSLNTRRSAAQTASLSTCYDALGASGWQALFALAEQTMVVAGWYVALHQAGWLSRMPVPLREAAEAYLLLNRSRNARLVADAALVSGLLAEIDCPTVYLKGMDHILNGTHVDAGARLTSDLDVLVPHAKVQQAAEHLLAHGGRFPGLPREVGLTEFHLLHHLSPLALPQRDSLVELHFSFVGHRTVWPSLPEIFARAGQVQGSVGGPPIAPCLTPTPVHGAALAILHSFVRPYGPMGSRLHLKDLWDIAALAAAGRLDFDDLQGQMREAGQAKAFGAAVACLDHLFGLDAAALGLTSLSPTERKAGHRTLKVIRAAHVLLSAEGRPGYGTVAMMYRRGAQIAGNSGYRRHLLSLATDRGYRRLWRQYLSPDIN